MVCPSQIVVLLAMNKDLLDKSKLYFLLVFCLLASVAYAQPLRVALTIREENDFFTRSDQYFTNGTQFGLLMNRPLIGATRGILPTFSSLQDMEYGITLTQNIYTPQKIEFTEFLEHDRPYAGTLFLSMYKNAVSKNGRLILRSEFSAGIVGHQSQANDVQRLFHVLTSSKPPQGWENQIPTTLLANYQFDLSALVFQRKHLALLSNGKINAGTVLDDLAAGATLRFGLLPPPGQLFFQHGKRLTAYLFMGGEQKFVVYNRLLSTGFEQQDIPIEEWAKSFNYGLEVAGRWFRFSYAVTWLSREREDLHTHRYGSFMMVFKL